LICYAFDIDGVVVDVSERLRVAMERAGNDRRLFWRYFFSEELMTLDKPRELGIELVRDRAVRGSIIIITGRPKRLRDVTLHQFTQLTGVRPYRVFMRSDRDYRKSCIVKLELLTKAIKSGLEVTEFHDDDEEVLKKVKSAYPWIKLYLHTPSSYVIY